MTTCLTFFSSHLLVALLISVVGGVPERQFCGL